MKNLIALDLGTTGIKGGVFGERGPAERVVSIAAPALDEDREAGSCTGDGGAYLAAVREALGALGPLAKPARLAVATQRSSFLVWERAGGRPLTPLISWRDRGAAAWCEARERELGPRFVERTGLRLSPHYAGPKLAVLLEREPALRRGLADASLRFGTLDTYLIDRLSDGTVYETDLTVAARTLMCDPLRRTWSPELLELFGVPAAGLPAIRPTVRRVTLGADLTLAGSIADQPAAALRALSSERSVLVNLGTGGFVLRRTGTRPAPTDGRYLAGPLLDDGTTTRFALEGTINGAGAAVDLFPAESAVPPPDDPSPGAFALPDVSGTGAPHWRAELGLTFSDAAAALRGPDRRRVVLEGIVFRVREIVDDLCPDGADRVVLSGGVSRDPFVAPALAACLDRPLELAADGDTTLHGAAALVVTLPPARTRTAQAGPAGAYLRRKYSDWRSWLRSVLD